MKIKKLNAMHPKSRKAAKTHKELIHIDKCALHIQTKDLKWKPELTKMHWFQKAVWMDAKDVYTRQELNDLALEFICRNDDEIMEAKAAAFAGAIHECFIQSPRLDQLQGYPKLERLEDRKC
ncbi:hypothetical protein GUITHDRAFT_149954 [Guillardia theta CCMP2712]|uniref:Uncharacterized protein n=1 Tax=Guillardia theta (strain CCMP2712) TaxID=905079 RepID=L1K3A2_GUITC|nr:hypothetical protein GUITHDRAFT_149954 [Guillardia theta CCMP2712]EKX55094.1 hypothetical protein GUITHDRAFT_149954 [Guillardia theta CCMP2712]|eukprot:XP_005842074.1 hypothetical protein GUITHDRAFT_149954 [Guillardia theta CCMP2712]